MFSLSPDHLSSLLSSLRSAPPDLLLVSPCGSQAPCHSSLLSLLSSSLSSLLAQHIREQGEVLAISLPMSSSAILDICNVTIETMPSYDVFQFSEDSLSEIEGHLTTTHETEHVTEIFYSQHETLKVESEFKHIGNLEKGTTDSEKLKVEENLCSLCDATFINMEPMTCPKCSISALEKAKAGLVQNIYLCTYCNEEFSSINELNSHEKRHPKQFHCPRMKCKKVLTSQQRLNHHITIHEKLPTLACDYCDKKSINKKRLKWHIRRVHNKKENFTCSECDAAKKTKILLERHIEYYHKTKFCLKCDQKFENGYSFMAHNKSCRGLK